MEDLLWALFRALPRRIGFCWVAEREDGQKMQVWRNSQEFLDLVALQTADPTGAHPVIPASQLHILHRPCAVELMPTVGRVVTMATAKLACSINRPVVHSGAKRCNSALSRMAIKCQGCRLRALGVKRPASKILCMVFSGRSFGKKVRVVRRVPLEGVHAFLLSLLVFHLGPYEKPRHDGKCVTSAWCIIT